MNLDIVLADFLSPHRNGREYMQSKLFIVWLGIKERERDHVSTFKGTPSVTSH